MELVYIIFVFGLGFLQFLLHLDQVVGKNGEKKLSEECIENDDCKSKQCCGYTGIDITNVCYSHCGDSESSSITVLQDDQVVTTSFQNRKYKGVKIEKSWYDAISFCCNDGGMLTDIRNEAEYDHLTDFVARNFFNKARNLNNSGWIGGSDILEKGKFTWLSNTKGIIASDYFRKNWKNIPGSFPGSCINILGGTNRRNLSKTEYLNAWTCHTKSFFICSY